MFKFFISAALLVATWQVQMAVESGVATVSTRRHRRMAQQQSTQQQKPCPPGSKCPTPSASPRPTK